MSVKNGYQYQRIFEVDGIEMWVMFTYDIDTNIEEGHGYHYINDVTIKIESVEIVIANKGVNIIKSMSDKQLESIKDLLTF